MRQIVEQIDWPCKVQRNYADQNLGCKQRVISGLDWVFDNVEEAIIIEDDVLPHSDFYGYCEALLERYRDDGRVMLITGCNFQDGRRRGTASYYFSKYNHVWGWATWRQAWKRNDPSLSFWPEWKVSAAWTRHVPDIIERHYWENIFNQMYHNQIDTWDYIWTASVWHHSGLTATPNVNLVTNIGFGPEGTHTVATEDQDGTPLHPLGPLTHPVKVKQDRKADRYVFDFVFGGREQRLHRRFYWRSRQVIGSCVQMFKRCLRL
ncbi:MAG: glycosyltransferase family 2 protein [Geobacteraceae bacterium]|nr:glycosyltransferase family 2 protein [Geobacteraceae bacterium]